MTRLRTKNNFIILTFYISLKSRDYDQDKKVFFSQYQSVLFDSTEIIYFHFITIFTMIVIHGKK